MNNVESCIETQLLNSRWNPAASPVAGQERWFPAPAVLRVALFSSLSGGEMSGDCFVNRTMQAPVFAHVLTTSYSFTMNPEGSKRFPRENNCFLEVSH